MAKAGVRFTAILALLAVVVLAVLIARGEPMQVVRQLGQLSGATVALVVICVLTAYGLRFAKWHLFVRGLGLDVPVGLSAGVFATGLLMVVTPAKVGEVWKALALQESKGVTVARALPAIVLERLTDLVAVGSLALLAAAAFGFGPLLAAAALLLLAGGILLLRWRRPWLTLLGRLEARFPNARAPAFLRSLYDGTHSLLAAGPLAIGGAVGLLAWGLEGVALWLLLDSLGHRVDLLWAVGVFCAGTLAGVASVLPGGLGTAEAGMAALLVAGGVPPETALAATLLARVFTLGLGVALGGVCYAGWWRPQTARRTTDA